MNDILALFQNSHTKYLIEFLQDDSLETIIIHFVADGVEVFFQNGNIQAEVKLREIIAKGEGGVANYHLGDVARGTTLRTIRDADESAVQAAVAFIYKSKYNN